MEFLKICKAKLKTLLKIAGLATVFIFYAYAKDCFTAEKSYYELQSEIIYNFVDYVSWSDMTAQENRKVCIIEDSMVIPYLNQLVKSNKKNLTVLRKSENDYLDDCDILFINEQFDGYVNNLLRRVRGKTILTLGNVSRFAEKGGIVQFRLRNKRVEFIINLKEMKNSQIYINDMIISASEIIK